MLLSAIRSLTAGLRGCRTPLLKKRDWAVLTADFMSKKRVSGTLQLLRKKIFQVSKKEKKFYQSIKIKSWRDKIPELGGFTSFHKNELSSSNDIEYLKRFITESNYGVIIHIENAILGFLIFLIPLCKTPSIWIPIFAVNFVLSMLPVFVLRYVTYTLNRLYDKQLKNK